MFLVSIVYIYFFCPSADARGAVTSYTYYGEPEIVLGLPSDAFWLVSEVKLTIFGVDTWSGVRSRILMSDRWGDILLLWWWPLI